MRDLNSVLKILSNDIIMNYCKDFDTVKSILDFVNTNVKSFDKVQFRGGNEHVIDEIATRLRNLFLENNYIDRTEHFPVSDHTMDLRKIVIFLILNTDATYKFNINNDSNLIHLIGICPQLSKFLLVSVIWELKLEQFFYEILSYTPCWFSFQYFEVAVSSLKHINEPYEVLQKVENLICSILTSITRTELRVIDKVDKKIILTKLYDYTMDLLRQFYTPDAEKFKQFTKKEFFKYSGYAIRHLLDMILFGFDCYEVKQQRKLDKSLDVYDICTEICPKNPIKQETYSEEIMEALHKIIISMLNSLQYNVCLVSIDVFMYWVEIDIDSDTTLQSIIGERSYFVLERMSTNSSLGHDIQPQLQAIAIRPKSFQEILKEATICDLLLKLDKESNINLSEKSRWLSELIDRPISLGNDECLETIINNVKLITIENCKSIMDFMILDLISQQDLEGEDSMDCENQHEQLCIIILQSLKNFNCKQMIHLIEYEIFKFGDRAKVFQFPDFKDRSTEFFNKFVTSFDLHSFLCVCFENPFLTWKLFFEIACQSKEQIKNFCFAVKQAYKISYQYVQELLNTSFSNHKSEEKFFPELVCELYFKLYLQNKSDFFKMFHTHVMEMIESENYENLKSVITILNLILNHSNSEKLSNFGEVTAPVLLMAAQIMDTCRWDLISYSDKKEAIVRCTIEFVQNLSKKFLPVATEKDKKWISQSIQESYRPITQYYFQKYSLGIGTKIKTLDRFLIPTEVNSANAEVVLVIHYVRCTTKETEWLVKCDRFEPHITKMMLILSNVVKEAGHPNAINTYRYCIINYKNILKKIIIPKIGNDTIKVKNLAIEILKILNLLPMEIYEDILAGFDSLLLEILAEPITPFDENMITEIRTAVQSLTDCSTKLLFEKKFEAIVSKENQ